MAFVKSSGCLHIVTTGNKMLIWPIGYGDDPRLPDGPEPNPIHCTFVLPDEYTQPVSFSQEATIFDAIRYAKGHFSLPQTKHWALRDCEGHIFPESIHLKAIPEPQLLQFRPLRRKSRRTNDVSTDIERSSLHGLGLNSPACGPSRPSVAMAAKTHMVLAYSGSCRFHLGSKVVEMPLALW
jgi:hypothetical protein